MRKVLYLLLSLLLLAGCNREITTQNTPKSAWGDVISLGQAEQSSAPGIWAATRRVTAVWVGSDANGIYHDSRALTDDGLSTISVLPLSPIHPYAQQLYPASGDNLHLLWLDANVQGETRLYSAVISPKPELMRGPIMVSDRVTLHYAAVPAPNGALWVVFSGGLVAEPGLYAIYLDAEGRARQDIIQLTTDADWPSLEQTNDGTNLIFWRRPADGAVQWARFVNGVLNTPQTVTHVLLQPGDRLESLSAALDSSHQYVFWNVTRASGQAETWFASGTPDAGDWQATRLGIAVNPDQAFQTGFNTGAAKAARPGDGWVSWAAPLNGQFTTLPVAAQTGNALALIYFREGQIAGYQEIMPATKLIGLPDLKADRNQFLYLSWAQFQTNGTADLRLASLRFSTIPKRP